MQITQTLKVKTSATTTSLLKLRRYLSIETLFLSPMIPSLRVYQIPGQNFSTYSCPVSSLLSLASNYRILIHSAIKITYICLESKTLASFPSLEQVESESVSCSVVSHSAILWTVAHHAPLSMGFSRQESWSG